MAVTQYIGARYVPIFADPAEWSSAKQYEPLTIVLHEGNSYTSRQFVPIGVDIDNTDFWAETGNYNAQVEAYRQEVLRFGEELVEKCFAFSDIEEMKSSEMLSDGDVCRTISRQTSGDDGGAYYEITTVGTANGMDIIELDNGLIAHLITDVFVTTSQLTGDSDITAALRRACELSNIVVIPYGSFTVTNVEVPPANIIMGCGFNATKITGNIQIVGANTHPNGGLYDLYIDGNISVGGSGNTGFGYSICNCELSNDGGECITISSNVWCNRFVHNYMHNARVGIKFAFNGIANSGANILIDNCTIYNMVDGIIVNGVPTDGYDIKIVGSDIEHCDGYSLTVNNGSSSGNIFIDNSHFELNGTGYIKNNGGNIYVQNSWLFLPDTATEVIFNNISGEISVNSCVTNAMERHFARIMGGRVFVAKDNTTMGGAKIHYLGNSGIASDSTYALDFDWSHLGSLPSSITNQSAVVTLIPKIHNGYSKSRVELRFADSPNGLFRVQCSDIVCDYSFDGSILSGRIIIEVFKYSGSVVVDMCIISNNVIKYVSGRSTSQNMTFTFLECTNWANGTIVPISGITEIQGR